MSDYEKPPNGPPDEPYPENGEGDPDEYVESGDAVEVHDAYLTERLAGGAPPDPAAYLRAIEQFQRLPGAMPAGPPVTPPPPDDAGPEAAPEPPEDEDAS